MEQIKILSIDNGFCRVNYKAKNEENQTVFYCIQDDGRGCGVNIYRCTLDLEPSHKVKAKTLKIFEVPAGDSDIEKTVRSFLKQEAA